MMALEMAMDEMAEALGQDPVAFRIRNDTQVDPGHPERRFSQRDLVGCLKLGAEKFGWASATRSPRRFGMGTGSSGWAWRRDFATTS